MNDLQTLIHRACLLEARCPKPGNVHPTASFDDLCYADFVQAAQAVSEVLPQARELGVGAAILAAVQRTRQLVNRPTNPNLGIILLLAPLAAVPGDTPLAAGINSILNQLTIDDARLTYQAIGLAHPGGMGQVDAADLSEAPAISLLAAMQLAADRDSIASEYATGFRIVLETGVPFLQAWPHLESDWEAALIHLQLTLMSRFPDTLIARKCGPELAGESASRAAAVLAAGGLLTEPGRLLMRQFDAWLRADGHRRNPGTTADLIAASLFAAARDGMIPLCQLRLDLPPFSFESAPMMSIPLPQGFRAAGLHCGIKKDPTLFDLSLFVSDVPATSAGVFTQNRVCGAPVKVSRERIRRTTSRAVIINSGNSNACTGEQGITDAQWMTALVAEQLQCAAEDVCVCSTGVIGRFLPREKLAAGIPQIVPQLAATEHAFEQAARGIMTTDTRVKMATRTVELNGRTARISGCSKGAAMIGPNMATMLCVIMTDAVLTVPQADAMLRHAVDRSFNSISVEGHTSTSDTVILLANGVSAGAVTAADTPQFQQALDEVAADLAMAIIDDAEGATHVITIDVTGCRTREEGLRIAKAVADSALVKTAIHGADPNWGRIVSAAGYSGVDLYEEHISLKVNGIPLYQAGTPLPFDATAASNSIRDNRATHVELSLTLGSQAVRYWTSDLTAEYVRLNADYTT